MSAYTFSIRCDVHRNVIYLEQRGRPNAADLREFKGVYAAELAAMRPGFSIVNDQRAIEPPDDEAIEVAKELVEITNRHEPCRVIRIVPADVFATISLEETLVAAKSVYPSIRVSSPEEAEEALATFAADVDT
jgi:hypothetical protein